MAAVGEEAANATMEQLPEELEALIAADPTVIPASYWLGDGRGWDLEGIHSDLLLASEIGMSESVSDPTASRRPPQQDPDSRPPGPSRPPTKVPIAKTKGGCAAVKPPSAEPDPKGKGRGRSPGPPPRHNKKNIAAPPEVDNEGREFAMDVVVVNFNNVGTTFGHKFLKDGTNYHWEGVRRCVQHLTKELGLKVVGVIFENWVALDNLENPTKVWGIPEDIRNLCECVEETPRLTGSHHKSADDEMTIKCAYRRNCRFMDNDNYRDWLSDMKSTKVRAWLEHCQERVHMRYYFDTGLGCFETLDGNALRDPWEAPPPKPKAAPCVQRPAAPPPHLGSSGGPHAGAPGTGVGGSGPGPGQAMQPRAGRGQDPVVRSPSPSLRRTTTPLDSKVQASARAAALAAATALPARSTMAGVAEALALGPPKGLLPFVPGTMTPPTTPPLSRAGPSTPPLPRSDEPYWIPRTPPRALTGTAPLKGRSRLAAPRAAQGWSVPALPPPGSLAPLRGALGRGGFPPGAPFVVEDEAPHGGASSSSTAMPTGDLDEAGVPSWHLPLHGSLGGLPGRIVQRGLHPFAADAIPAADPERVALLRQQQAMRVHNAARSLRKRPGKDPHPMRKRPRMPLPSLGAIEIDLTEEDGDREANLESESCPQEATLGRLPLTPSGSPPPSDDEDIGGFATPLQLGPLPGGTTSGLGDDGGADSDPDLEGQAVVVDRYLM